MDVAAWLQGLGLQQYEPAFRQNDVDAEVLPKLTAEDLVSIGVTSVGHRRKLLAAVAALVYEAPAAASERRQLTVMFCELVGSTGLSAGLDPEDLREVIADYHRAVAEVVRGLDGSVAKYMGTESWLISAIRERMRTMPSGPSVRVSASSMRWAGSTANPSRCEQNRDRDGARCGRRSDRRRLGAGAIRGR